MKQALSLIIFAAFLANTLGPIPTVQAGEFRLPVPGVMVHLSPGFTPAHLQGITIHPDNALQFDFLINKGDQDLEGDQKKTEYKKLVKYFLASLTIPDEDQWVNLSPYEKNRIIKDDFGKTEMGRDLLAEDYMLKQITSSLIYPEDGLGKKFWDKIYERAWTEYHTTNIPVNTFNKVWIVPDQAVVYESGNSAYILQSHLKVMLEEDYLSLEKHTAVIAASSNNTHTIGSQVIREIILPELEKEVNEGKNFANLRQMYSGMILATWYKKALKESLLGKVYADKVKVKGIDQNPQNNEAIYQRYLKAFKKGVFNYIKEDMDQYTNESIPRKYFSGGFMKGDFAMVENVIHEGNPNLSKYVDPATFTAGKIDKALISLDSIKDALMFPSDYWLAELANAELEMESGRQWMGAKQILDRATREIPTYRVFLTQRLKVLRTRYNQYQSSHYQGETVPDLDSRNAAMTTEKKTVAFAVLNPSFYSADVIALRNRGYNVVFASSQKTLEELMKSSVLLVTDTTPSWVMAAQNDLSADQRKIPILALGVDDDLLWKGTKFPNLTFLPQPHLSGISGSLNKILSHDSAMLSPEDMEKNSEYTILVVDDDNSTRKLLEAVIPRSGGFKVEVAKDGNEALEMVKNSPGKYLAVFTDYDMPNENGLIQNGLDLTKEIYKIYPLLPVVMHTANNEILFHREEEQKLNPNIVTILDKLSSMMKSSEIFNDIRIKAEENGQSKKGSIAEEQGHDAAMNGGIDFNSANLNLQIKRDGKGVPLPLAQQDMTQLNRIQGFDPEIIDIRPAVNVPIMREIASSASVR